MRRVRVIWVTGLFVVAAATVTAQTKTDAARLQELSREYAERLDQKRPAAYYDMLASDKTPFKQLKADRDIELMFIDEHGLPKYLAVENLTAARTISTDDVWPGGSTGFNLSGAGTVFGKLAVWDGGGVRWTHRELTGRVLQVDNPSTTHYHSTHVAGTMIATGVTGQAKGMSYQAVLGAYDWNNDESEMATAAAQGLQVSNHSYGTITGWRNDGDWYWWGDISVSPTEDYGFGFYNYDARVWDQISYEAPYYLIVKSAGNDRSDAGPAPGETYWVYDGDWVESTEPRDPDCGPDGYDCVSWNSTAKNILTVGAVNDIPAGYSTPGGVVMSSFSAWGPTDDGRIKPDIVANGVSLYSCLDDADNSYAYLSGTSMSTPNASGSINLLARFYEDTHGGELPRASTLKALVIHTADESGSYTGPDYRFGWGLMNTSTAATVISYDQSGEYIVEATLNDGQVHEHHLTVEHTSPLRLTMAWTDLPGTPPPPSLDPTNLMLVNDLDMRLEHVGSSAVYYPYVLNPAVPASAPTTGDNFRDNVEQIYVAAPPPGEYVVRVSHKGTLAAPQVYSLISSASLAVCVDSDGDGFGDPGNPASGCDLDNCPDIYNPDQQDSDNDGVGDLCDACPHDADDDADGDGYCADVDNCPGLYNPDQTDSDGDLVGDGCDICAGYDDRLDADSDGIPDGCDICAGYDDNVDSDGDLFPDGCDNCPLVYNPGQEDFNGDDVGDVCCCVERVGNANGEGGDEPTIGDVNALIAAIYTEQVPDPIAGCFLEADVNQSGGATPVYPTDFTIGDINSLIEYLYIKGPYDPVYNPGGVQLLNCP